MYGNNLLFFGLLDCCKANKWCALLVGACPHAFHLLWALGNNWYFLQINYFQRHDVISLEWVYARTTSTIVTHPGSLLVLDRYRPMFGPVAMLDWLGWMPVQARVLHSSPVMYPITILCRHMFFIIILRQQDLTYLKRNQVFLPALAFLSFFPWYWDYNLQK